MNHTAVGDVTLPTRPVAAPAGGVARGRTRAPGSKSHTNRLLAVASLAHGTSTLRGPLHSDDSAAMRALARGLGATVDDTDGDVWRVEGTAGAPAGGGTVNVGQSGTAMRFGAALGCVAAQPITVDGHAQLRRRPLGALTAALSALGATVADADGFPPVTAGGGLRGGAVAVDCAGSSQFASAVLLVAPYAQRDVVMATSGLGAAAYVELTAAVMAAAGARVDPVVDGDAPAWVVTAGQHYRGVDADVEPDASAAAHLLALAAATGGEVTVVGLDAVSQPDGAVPEQLAQMGCTVTRRHGDVTVAGPDRLTPVDADLTATPDQLTTLAALAVLASGTSRLTGVAVARGHETDRPAVLATELAKLGAQVDQRPDGLVVHGVGPAPDLSHGPVVLDAHDDHRLAMAFAAVAVRVPGVAVGGPGCVAKTYPAFWRDAAALGLEFAELPSDAGPPGARP